MIFQNPILCTLFVVLPKEAKYCYLHMLCMYKLTHAICLRLKSTEIKRKCRSYCSPPPSEAVEMMEYGAGCSMLRCWATLSIRHDEEERGNKERKERGNKERRERNREERHRGRGLLRPRNSILEKRMFMAYSAPAEAAFASAPDTRPTRPTVTAPRPP